MFAKVKKSLTAIGASLVVAVSVVAMTGLPAAATSGAYCGPGVSKPCVTVWTKTHPVPDCKVYFRFFNPTNHTLPRSIAVFHNGQEVFGDDDFMAPGFTPVLSQPPVTFGPLEDGAWRMLVKTGNKVLADKTFNFNCSL